MPVFSESEITKKTNCGRIIIVNEDKVYDVTEFLNRHPGGADYLQDCAGQDVTEILQREIPHRHSSHAYSILKKYCIGRLSKHQKNGVKHREINGNVKNGIVANGVSVVNKNEDGYSLEDTEMEDLVDWNKPMLGQVMYLGDKYFDWVHQPVDKHIRLFHSDFCEYFSQCPWYVVPIFWIPVALSFLWFSYHWLQEAPCVWPQNNFPISFEFRVCHMLPLFIAGLIMWTWLEYVIHRWLFHLRPPSNIPILVLLHFVLHGQHHKTPMDKMRLVFPPVPAVILGVIVFSIYAIFIPPAISLSLFAGTILGYLSYDLTHYYLHHGRPMLPYFQSLKRYHVKHHFVNQSLGFGISSKLWDYPFGTIIPE